eukprot:111988-Chlamydomonas_euryale.AAC.1
MSEPDMEQKSLSWTCNAKVLFGQLPNLYLYGFFCLHPWALGIAVAKTGDPWPPERGRESPKYVSLFSLPPGKWKGKGRSTAGTAAAGTAAGAAGTAAETAGTAGKESALLAVLRVLLHPKVRNLGLPPGCRSPTV